MAEGGGRGGGCAKGIEEERGERGERLKRYIAGASRLLRGC